MIGRHGEARPARPAPELPSRAVRPRPARRPAPELPRPPRRGPVVIPRHHVLSVLAVVALLALASRNYSALLPVGALLVVVTRGDF